MNGEEIEAYPIELDKMFDKVSVHGYSDNYYIQRCTMTLPSMPLTKL